jgi:putative ABC transport system permease protein
LTETRIKEIGIRKVHGANVYEILGHINKSFIIKICLAFVIACPVAYHLISQWLESFAYKTPIGIWVFVLVGAGVLTLSVITVSLQSSKSALKNPSEALRYE